VLWEGLQDNVGFGWGFGIPAAVMILAVVIFLAGSKIYRFKAAQGSPLATIAQVVIAAAWKWHLGPVSENVLYAGPVHGNGPLEKLCHTEQFRQVPPLYTHHTDIKTQIELKNRKNRNR